MSTKIKPTDDQVVAEIALLQELKPKVRQRSAFGDDNHAAIGAQIDVLQDRMSMDDVYDSYGEEAAGDEFDQYVLDNALHAHDWLHGESASDEESPAVSWRTAL